MSTKPTIKIIKRDERNLQEANSAATAAAKKTTPVAARDMVATVTGWVSEFQQKSRIETKQAIKNLFSDTTPEPSKA